MDRELASISFDDSLRSRVERRMLFLLQEARHGSPRDHAITYTMRAISNYLTIGCDAQSYKIKTMSRQISSGALKLLQEETSFKDWAKKTINEHPVPLAATWAWLCSHADSLSLDEVWNHFEGNLMTVITAEEDRKLNEKGQRSTAAADRYSQAGFQQYTLKHRALEAFRLRDFATFDLCAVPAV